MVYLIFACVAFTAWLLWKAWDLQADQDNEMNVRIGEARSRAEYRAESCKNVHETDVDWQHGVEIDNAIKVTEVPHRDLTRVPTEEQIAVADRILKNLDQK